MTPHRPATRVIAECFDGNWSVSLREEDSSIRILIGSRGQRRRWRQLRLALRHLERTYTVSSLQLFWHSLH